MWCTLFCSVLFYPVLLYSSDYGDQDTDPIEIGIIGRIQCSFHAIDTHEHTSPHVNSTVSARSVPFTVSAQLQALS